ncbi:hypothetical protein V2A60_002567 [Cordyceps javanica]|uniref:RING finger domain-containing protein n=1 Tax=Cordyceps javanica TaxID=43265 RepID=A0A545UY57_9HYPO|nr:RING finger domain-containing protein [Cordyceps javanica]TQW06270.1 RING finger domain protein [Cordyceps javanica]
MPIRGFPLDSVSSDFQYHPHAFGYLHPRPRLSQPPESPVRRRPRRTRPGRDDIVTLLNEIMTTPEHSGFEALSDDDDDLVEIVSARPSRPTSTVPAPLALPAPGSRPSSTGDARRRQQAASRPSSQVPRQDDAVIDLTEEPDSPVEVRPPRLNTARDAPVRLPPMRTHRHPRRTNSQRLTPPRLSRSESIMLASESSFIDLTGEDDAISTTNATLGSSTTHEPPRRSNRNHQPPIILPHPDSTGGSDHLVDLEFLNPRHAIRYGFASSFARGFGRTLADILSADFLTSQPSSIPLPTGLPARLYAQRQPRQPSPPREMPPLPPTRSGFTRDTAVEPGDNAEERVVVCPACDEELAYDPTAGGAVQTTATGAKKRKRAAGDHHFWAVKKCGHVYCAECFENRRPTKANPDGVGFAGPPGKLPYQAPHDLRCAVEDCDSKVTNKTEWVGIFL